jgi:hypothetical protein
MIYTHPKIQCKRDHQKPFRTYEMNPAKIIPRKPTSDIPDDLLDISTSDIPDDLLDISTSDHPDDLLDIFKNLSKSFAQSLFKCFPKVTYYDSNSKPPHSCSIVA